VAEPTTRRRLSTVAVGAAAGMGINDLRGTLDYRWAAGSVTVIAVVAVAAWLYPRTQAARRTSWILVGGAGVLAAVAVLSTEQISGYAGLSAVVLICALIVWLVGADEATMLLIESTAIAAGVAAIGMGASELSGGESAIGVALICAGTGLAGAGLAILIDSKHGLTAALVIAGGGIVGLGSAWWAGGDLIRGVAAFGAGTAFAMVGVALGAGASNARSLAVVVFGLAALAGGGTEVYHGGLTFGVAFIAFGVAITGVGIAGWIRGAGPAGLMNIVAGVAGVWLGIAVLVNGVNLAGAAIVALGAAAIVAGAVIAGRNATARHLRAWLDALVPPQVPDAAESEPAANEAA
jgi:hypothetical protein